MKAELTINVQIGVTPEVTNLVMALLHKETPAAPATTAAPAATVENPAPEAPAASGRRGRKSKTETQDPAPEPSAEAAPANDVDQGQAQEPAPEPEKPVQLTEEDVREAMHRTRTRIEGEGYKDNTEMEGRKKYHTQLTATFKQISALLGADKPSALPADQREAFIKQCDDLQVLEDGSIGTKCPY